MVKHPDKALEVKRPEVVPEVVPNAQEVVPDSLALNLFDIDPHIEQEGPVRLDLNLDQLEEVDE